ncbi:nucleotidyltransferase domain-containing protein [Spirosoma montaniterrae]|uniref:Polymerase nucleotidyl transferase domain-containing protein n=1 Tax=Spirosoma montaniterrae TaxID=1178516 RepID=A0A1P9X1P8_9BACT|nr:nucleotidyltransferase domain-containing protein [Spirosoma montaniterrae]AQG81554.1 hypothetical protein AWR27_20900 [Spirosoma montaniterrae]
MNYTAIQPLLSEFKHAVQELYQDRLSDIYLFGSFARNEATQDSDIDLLVILNDETISPFSEINLMGDIAYRLDLRYDTLVSVVPTTQQRFEQLASPLYKQVKREGRRL